jgi:MFS family permease
MADAATSRIQAQGENGNAIATAQPKLGLRTTLRALRHRNFQLFFSGQFISLCGTWMQSIAQDWLVYRLTGSSWLLGVVAFAGQIPVLLLSPVAGIVADRRKRQYTVIATQTSSMLIALTLAALTLTHVVKVWEIIVLATSLGIVNAFDVPARQSFIIEMVGREDLLNAIALNSAMYNGARVIGPAIAGILVAWIGEGWCFFANGISYIAVITGLFMMRVTPRELERAGSAFEKIIEGFRFVHHTKPVRAILFMVGLVSLATMPVMVLMPIFADRILHGGARGLGLLMGVQARRQGIRALGVGGGNRCGYESDFVCDVSALLAVGGAFAGRGIRHADSDGLVQHADPGDGAGPAARARDVGLLDDADRHRADRGADRRGAGRQDRGAVDRGDLRNRVVRRSSPICLAVAGTASAGAGTDQPAGVDARAAARDHPARLTFARIPHDSPRQTSHRQRRKRYAETRSQVVP